MDRLTANGLVNTAWNRCWSMTASSRQERTMQILARALLIERARSKKLRDKLNKIESWLAPISEAGHYPECGDDCLGCEAAAVADGVLGVIDE